MDNPVAPERSGVRLAELAAALSLGIDLGFGQPMEHVLRQCLMTVTYADRVEVINVGDAFYMTPGHSPKALAGSEFVMFSPKEELAALEAHFAAKMQAMQAAPKSSADRPGDSLGA